MTEVLNNQILAAFQEAPRSKLKLDGSNYKPTKHCYVDSIILARVDYKRHNDCSSLDEHVKFSWREWKLDCDVMCSKKQNMHTVFKDGQNARLSRGGNAHLNLLTRTTFDLLNQLQHIRVGHV